jgi:hypothetical protein
VVAKRDTLDDPVMQMMADRLSSKFSADDGVVTTEEVDDAVRESAESLEDAPVQTFVPILAEHKASARLRKLTKERDPAR